MFKISHEVPVELLEDSLQFNDYEYCLGHLFDKNPKYREFYKKQSAETPERTMILDNSAYELGKPMDGMAYLSVISELEPTEYIVPDIRNDADSNLKTMRRWLKYVDDPIGVTAKLSKTIGVVHGESYEAYCQNYSDIVGLVDKVAFSFEDFFIEWAENESITLAEARTSIIKEMVEDKIISYMKPHHILGALSPTEYQAYCNWGWIETVDTSNPVLHGLLGQQYKGEEGLTEKSSIKLETLIDVKVPKALKNIVLFNVKWFREQFKGLDRHSKRVDKERDKVPVDDGTADYYREFPIETIELMRRIYGNEKTADWCEITAFKYRMRMGIKPTADIEIDLKKEKWYLDKAIELRK